MSIKKIRPAQTYRWARRRGHRHLNQELRAQHSEPGKRPQQVDWSTFNVQQAKWGVGTPPSSGHVWPRVRGRTYMYMPQPSKAKRRERRAA